MTTRVHLNLNRGDWSITRKGQPVEHVASCTLQNAFFRVSEASRQRILRSEKQHREVHAWAVGDLINPQALARVAHLPRVEITYNFKRSGSFTRRDNGAAIHSADYLIFEPGRRAFAINPR